MAKPIIGGASAPLHPAPAGTPREQTSERLSPPSIAGSRFRPDLLACLELTQQAAVEIDAIAQMLLREAEVDPDGLRYIVRTAANRLSQLFAPLNLWDSGDPIEDSHRAIYGSATPFSEGGAA